MTELTKSYVYKTTCPNTGEFYIGCRTIDGDMHLDGEYMGSRNWPRLMRENGRTLEKSVIAVFYTLDAARDFEYETVQKNAKNPLCKNVYGKGNSTKRGAELRAYNEYRGIERITVELPLDLMQTIRARASIEGVSLGDIVRILLRKGLAA